MAPPPPGCGVGAGPRNAHALCAAPPTRRSAPFGHFRLFVLNSGRVFFSCSWGGPGGSGAPPTPDAAPACAQLARSRDGRSVSPRPAWPGPRRPLLRPRPRPVCGPGRLGTPARALAPLVGPARGAPTWLGMLRALAGPTGPGPGTGHGEGPDPGTGHLGGTGENRTPGQASWEGQTLKRFTEEG